MIMKWSYMMWAAMLENDPVVKNSKKLKSIYWRKRKSHEYDNNTGFMISRCWWYDANQNTLDTTPGSIKKEKKVPGADLWVARRGRRPYFLQTWQNKKFANGLEGFFSRRIKFSGPPFLWFLDPPLRTPHLNTSISVRPTSVNTNVYNLHRLSTCLFISTYLI